MQGQDKVYKDVIELLESISINMTPATKEDIRDLSPPDPAVREWTSRLSCTTPMTSSTTSSMRCCTAVQPRSAAAAPLLARLATRASDQHDAWRGEESLLLTVESPALSCSRRSRRGAPSHHSHCRTT